MSHLSIHTVVSRADGNRLTHSVAARTAESSVELRFRERQDARRKNHPDADADR